MFYRVTLKTKLLYKYLD